MGKAPAVIIIARHGARLDAENPAWSTTASAPYDTPLTYGGWIQTRALGARIASLLHARELANTRTSDLDPALRRSSEPSMLAADAGSAPAGRRKKQHVIIHSSPFLRCLQSSVAIAAGMAQYKGNLQTFEALDTHQPPLRPPSRSPKLFSSIPRSHTLGAADLPAILATSRPGSAKSERQFNRQSDEAMPDLITPTLRVDAFLGEWLSPDYFEHIRPPPASAVMVDGAKQMLEKPAEPIQGAKLEAAAEAYDHATAPDERPGRRSTSRHRHRASLARRRFAGYSPPTPLYSISPGQPIPTGYVAHARDACVNLDATWDSMQAPQSWGDGGEHGEEWSSMHTRFRYGIKSMIDWYKGKPTDYDPQRHPAAPHGDDDGDDDSETVLVMVTHGAGCNALIGALTNQPVLMDVGMASLTMAVRKANCDASLRRSSSASTTAGLAQSPSQSRTRRSSTDLGLSLEYDMRLIASSEHLRAGADPLKIPQLQSTSFMSCIPEGGGARRGSDTPSIESSPPELLQPRPKNSSLGTSRRSAVKSLSSRSYVASQTRPSSSASTGLWGSQRQSTIDSTSGGGGGGGDSTPPSPTSTTGPPPAQETTAGPPSAVPRAASGDQTRGGGSGMWNGSERDVSRRGTVGLWGSQAVASAATSRRSTISERA